MMSLKILTKRKGGVRMEFLDEKLITLNDGVEDREVKVYLKEIVVKNGFKDIRAFSKIQR